MKELCAKDSSLTSYPTTRKVPAILLLFVTQLMREGKKKTGKNWKKKKLFAFISLFIWFFFIRSFISIPKGLKAEGIFRIGTDLTELSEMKERIETGFFFFFFFLFFFFHNFQKIKIWFSSFLPFCYFLKLNCTKVCIFHFKNKFKTKSNLLKKEFFLKSNKKT